MAKRHYIEDDYTLVRNQIIRTDKVSTADMAVFFCLSFYADNETGKCYPNLTTLAEASKSSVNTVRKSIKNLEQAGFIKVEKKKIDGMRLSNVYTILNPDEGKKDKEDSNSTKRRICTAPSPGSVQNPTLDSNYTAENKNYTNNKTLSKDRGGTSSTHQKQTTLINVPKPLEKPKKKRRPSFRELALDKIGQAKKGLIAWDKVTYRDFTFYYIEKHNEMFSKEIDFNRYESVGVIRDSLIHSFDIPRNEVCDYIDRLIEIYSDSPQSWGYLSFNMIRNNHPMMKDLMLRVKLDIEGQKEPEVDEEQKKIMEEWKWKMDNIDKLPADEVF